jgi:hypothetical protein
MKKTLLWFIAICVAAVVLWRGAFPTYYWTQKETIEVEISGKVYTGSGVVECSVQSMPQILPESGIWKYGKRGEATVVELPDGRYLFGLITGACGLPFALFKDKYNSSASDQVLSGVQVISNLREVREIPLDNPNLHPVLVVFYDIDDPKTVRQVTVANVSEDLGTEYRISKINFELNPKHQQSSRIDSLLPWIKNYHDKMLDGNRLISSASPHAFANKLTYDDFIGED